jgi:hypothetical protein
LYLNVGKAQKELLARNAKALNGATFDEMRAYDFWHIGGLHLPVPDVLGVNDHRGAVLADVEASRLLGTNLALESRFGELGFEEIHQLQPTSIFAAAARMAGGALVGADEDVGLEFSSERKRHSSVSID